MSSTRPRNSPTRRCEQVPPLGDHDEPRRARQADGLPSRKHHAGVSASRASHRADSKPAATPSLRGRPPPTAAVRAEERRPPPAHGWCSSIVPPARHRDRPPRAWPAHAQGWPAPSEGLRTRAGAGTRGSPRSRPRTTLAEPGNRAPLPERARRWSATRPVPHPGRHRHGQSPGPLLRTRCSRRALLRCVRRPPRNVRAAPAAARPGPVRRPPSPRRARPCEPTSQRCPCLPHLSSVEATPHVVASGK